MAGTMKEIITGIRKQSLVVLVPLCFVSLFFAGWRVPFSMAVGWAVGIGNVTGLAWSIKTLLGSEKAQSKMVLLSIFKLLVIFSILLTLAVFRLLNAWGFLAGFTVVMALLIKEGLVRAKQGG
jgi:hypothetical protein